MGRYFETKQQECFGVAIANFLMRYGRMWGDKTPEPERVMESYWKQPFVESDGATQAVFVPYLTRKLTEGWYDARVTLTREPDYEQLIEQYGGGIGLLLADEERRGNIVQVESIKRVNAPCIALLENSIPYANSDQKYYFNSHAVLALGNHFYIDYGQLLYDDQATLMGAVHLTLQKNPLKEMCAERGIKVEIPEPLVWEL